MEKLDEKGKTKQTLDKSFTVELNLLGLIN